MRHDELGHKIDVPVTRTAKVGGRSVRSVEVLVKVLQIQGGTGTTIVAIAIYESRHADALEGGQNTEKRARRRL